MERLTTRDRKGRAYFDDDGILIRGANGTFHQKKDMTAHYIHDRFVALDKTIERLAAYEDTGLEPEKVITILAERDALLDALRGSCGDCVFRETKKCEEPCAGCYHAPQHFCEPPNADSGLSECWQWRGTGDSIHDHPELLEVQE